MKKSLLALAVLGAFAGAASAQSSVTIYGKIDLGVGKSIGTKDKAVQDAAGSRIGFRGVEDLGGGLAAIFGFEHRLSPDTGAVTSAAFWNGYSNVGLRGGFGAVTIGRHYTAAFTDVQNQIDPFGGDTVAALRGLGMIPARAGHIRVADSVRYDIAASGFKLAATIAEATQSGGSGAVTTAGPDRPFSIAGSYSAGPLFIGASYENPQFNTDKLTSVGMRYTFAPVTLRAGFSTGKGATGATADQKVRGYLVGATITLGAGDLLVGFAQQKVTPTATGVATTGRKFGLGYHYNLSKRTKLYADYGRVNNVAAVVGSTALADEKGGYDFGIQHNF